MIGNYIAWKYENQWWIALNKDKKGKTWDLKEVFMHACDLKKFS